MMFILISKQFVTGLVQNCFSSKTKNKMRPLKFFGNKNNQ